MKFIKLAPGASTANGVTIQPRRFDFSGFDDVPHLWVGDHIWLTQMFNALSVLVPEAERFMIKAIRNAVDHIDDPALKDECRAFVIQEAHHHKIHDKLNEALINQGYSIKNDIKETNRLFVLLGKLPLKFQLGIASALEHLTAIVSNMGLEEMENFNDISHPKMRDFWQWHGAEELEHKTVVFELYNKLGGGYLQRATSAVITLLVGGAYMFVIHIRLMKQFKRLDISNYIRIKNEPKSAARVKCDGMMKRFSKKFLGMLFAYFKPGFHPLDFDDTETLNRWYEYNQTLDKQAA